MLIYGFIPQCSRCFKDRFKPMPVASLTLWPAMSAAAPKPYERLPLFAAFRTLLHSAQALLTA